MYNSVLALLLRSLRVDVRSRAAHGARFALCVAIYLAVIRFQVMAAWAGAPGLDFFRSILFLNVTFATLLGISIFSSAISEEKEEDTLGLLRMAGVDSLGLLLGKAGGRLTQALALLIVQLPFMLLSITLGGVGFDQIQSAYVALTAYLVMLAGLGVLFSTVCESTLAASCGLVSVLAFYTAVPLSCQSAISGLKQSGGTSSLLPALEFVSQACIFFQTSDILSTGFESSFFTVQVISNVLVGLVSFGLAWALFDVCTRNSRSEPLSRGLVTQNATGFRFFNPGRVFSNSLIWKDFHFATGGVAGLLIRTACYIALLLVIAVFFADASEIQLIARTFLAFQFAVLPLDASLLISRAMQNEVRGQTIASLVMLPRSIPYVVYSKLAGALIGLFPGLTCCVVAFCCSGLLEEWLRTDTRSEYPLLMLMGSTYLILLPHLTAVLALVVRWGATPIAIGALYAIQMAESMITLPVFVLMPSFGMASMLIYMGITATINLVLCFVCHYEMLRRFRLLAEK